MGLEKTGGMRYNGQRKKREKSGMSLKMRVWTAGEISDDLLEGFAHEQRISKIWTRGDGGWELRDANEQRSWSTSKRRWIASYLRDQIMRGGCAIGAYQDGKLVGFASVDGPVVDGTANLTMLFVDDAMQRRGVGRELFFAAAGQSAKRAQRLYISAIASQETIAFYTALGCGDAPRMEEFMDTEEDRPMGFRLEKLEA